MKGQIKTCFLKFLNFMYMYEDMIIKHVMVGKLY